MSNNGVEQHRRAEGLSERRLHHRLGRLRRGDLQQGAGGDGRPRARRASRSTRWCSASRTIGRSPSRGTRSGASRASTGGRTWCGTPTGRSAASCARRRAHAFYDSTVFVLMGDHGAAGVRRGGDPAGELSGADPVSSRQACAGGRAAGRHRLLDRRAADDPRPAGVELRLEVLRPRRSSGSIPRPGRAVMTHNNDIALMRGGTAWRCSASTSRRTSTTSIRRRARWPR